MEACPDGDLYHKFGTIDVGVAGQVRPHNTIKAVEVVVVVVVATLFDALQSSHGPHRRWSLLQPKMYFFVDTEMSLSTGTGAASHYLATMDSVPSPPHNPMLDRFVAVASPQSIGSMHCLPQ